jgi:hypothetical protein
MLAILHDCMLYCLRWLLPDEFEELMVDSDSDTAPHGIVDHDDDPFLSRLEMSGLKQARLLSRF